MDQHKFARWIASAGATDSRRSLVSRIMKGALGTVLPTIGSIGSSMGDVAGHSRPACERACRRRFRTRQSQARRTRCINQCSRHNHRTVALGLAFPYGKDDPGLIDVLARRIGRMPAFVLWFRGWPPDGAKFGTVELARLRAYRQRGIVPLVSWDPWGAWYEPEGGPNPRKPQPYQLRHIVNGVFDDYIDSWATGLAAFGHPVFLSFAHEMNGDWFPWGVGVNGNTAEDFVAAWRHVHLRFTAAGVTNVRWVWTPNYDYGGPVNFAEIFPGNSYLDWVGVNGYNWGTSMYWAACQCRSDWLSFDTLFADSYDALTALSTKPIMITETASAEDGGDKAAWITNAFLNRLPTRFPRIGAVGWFHATDERTADGDFVLDGKTAAYWVDWRINSSPQSLEAFVRVAKSPYLQGRLPPGR